MKSKGRGKPRKRAKAEDVADLVKTEIDAAEALAEFSKQVVVARDDDSGMKLQWQRKRKRSTKYGMESSSSSMLVASNSAVDFPLVKDEYPSDSDKERGGGSLPLVTYNRFDTSEDSLEPGFRAESPSSPLPPLGTEGYSAYVKSEAGLVQQCAFKSSLEFEEKPKAISWSKLRGMKQPKLEDGRSSFHAKDRRMSSTLGCGKGRSARAVLTEEEKEIRRLRRIEANRESARQTIRRKQKMCEEMTLKANELSSANDRCRKEIEAIREENRRLYEAGCSLRKQLADKYIELGASFPVLPTLEDESKCAKKPDGFKEAITETVQVNRQDDNIELVESQTSHSTAAVARTNQTAAPLLTVERYTTMVPPRFYSFPYSFYTGRKDALAAATAAQARRRRKELTRSKNLLARQVSLNS
ncbi:hypothetical protein SELMODRAFT_439314 [Selaginella moellendorffii]|uniref:BZIP domain-containing protein n=1 Tax=Selaginella moellendorffii TaxID=88036 RepID=D8R3I4_SELML|nr:uncharacterized protein LOC9635675 [Selaginella moellendorffii]EFJ32949.1 hypothetical protein SELMODRAFT_439314 [Selaginella moellendorffii]|eukprot:XP_002965529.1 uncharacterized protein LOC9635675 [Selaginella moellendorffii]